MSGWIKLHRKLLKSRAWCGADAEGKVILITLLLTACHSVTHWQVTTDKNASKRHRLPMTALLLEGDAARADAEAARNLFFVYFDQLF